MTAGTLVDLTPAAAEKVLELKGEDPSRSFLRVFVAGEGCCSTRYGMSFAETADAGDELVEAHGVTMTVAAASKESVSGVQIDYVDGEQGTGFMVTNPAASGGGGGGGCGCGHGHGH